MYKLKQEFIDLLNINRELRLKVALNLDMKERTIEMAIERQSTSLTNYGCLVALKEHTGNNIEDLLKLVNETVAA